MTDATSAQRARALIARLDLTNLAEDCTEADVAALCVRAETAAGPVAAICIWPDFVGFARRELSARIKVATVVNFPLGGSDVEATLIETRRAIADGADEIDLVIAYDRLADDPGFVEAQVRTIRAICGHARLKAILETGKLYDEATIRSACRAALAGGADFLKTSTGKVEVNATPGSAKILLEEIAKAGGTVGFKPAGGIKTFEDADGYMRLAETICGLDYPAPERFRLGASGVLADLLAIAQGAERPGGGASY
ncbi:deoxyribose-phosphate aldolase [Jiella sp. MQZ9-1]|uniref:Deoxyribose-phosphate aldolase n=1 Tax=Jiella flava TaxID=2816857 RepID=A0A939JV22_9HYPH|nr:deoxyribose-phosphate aldolase [Jiella flava]MBO0661999.1 deoxyribose-phosphate aldolase [Jiella flava]MCD2470674.1 deoxyribose-phosphate aldolase [Jiella flava]